MAFRNLYIEPCCLQFISRMWMNNHECSTGSAGHGSSMLKPKKEEAVHEVL